MVAGAVERGSRCIQSQVAESDVASGSSLQFWIPAYEMAPPTATATLPDSVNLS